MMILIVLFAIETFSAYMAHAHSFYDARCCHDKDCAPVVKFETLPDGNFKVTLKNGISAVLAKDYADPKRISPMPEMLNSPDTKMHACILTPDGIGETMFEPYVRCIYMPGAM